MEKPVAIVIGLVIAAGAIAQINNPAVSWQVSTDGVTWSSSLITSGGVVRIRGVASWDRPTGDESALAALTFDGGVSGSLAETFDPIANGPNDYRQNRPLQQSIGRQNGLGMNLGDGNMRFSRDTDSGIAGSNTNYWVIGQDANIDLDGDGVRDSYRDQDISNSVVFLKLSLNIDASADHTMTVSSVLSSSTGSSSPFRLYNNAASGGSTSFIRSQVLINNATISVVTPTPGALTLLGLGGLAATRRRR